MVNVSLVVGNPRRRSRTASVATTVIEALLPAGTFQLAIIDLADYAEKLFDWADPEVSALNHAAAASDLLVVASPTYKATYTGMLKAFFDRYPNLGLRGVVAIPVMTGDDPRHSMSAEVHLRPLLVELGAVVPTDALYFVMSKMDDVEAVVADWVTEARGRLEAHLPEVLGAVSVPSAEPLTDGPPRE